MSESAESLKQRIAGAFVILTLAIVFLPMIFDEPHDLKTVKVVPIPQQPEFEPVKPTPAKPTSPPKYVIEDAPKASVKAAPKASPVPASKQSSKPAEQEADPIKAKYEELKAVRETNSAVKPSPTSNQDLPVFKNVWVVQLGTFSNKNNAYGLRDRMRKSGMDGYAKAIKVKGKTVYRVFTGPFVNKLQAQKTKKKVDSKFRVKSILIFFDA